MKVNLKWGVNVSAGNETFDFQELGISFEEWSNMDEYNKIEYMQNWLDELPDRTCMIVEYFEIID